MTPQKELKLAYSLAVALLIVGVLSFAAFPAKTPDEPIRIMYKSVAGKVLFDHKTHRADSGYSLACEDCHHHFEFEGSSGIDGEEPVVQACAVCHPFKPKEQAYPESCMECHDEEDLDEDVEVTKRTDAFHDQCEGCHQETEIGPVEERCNWCHVM
jgi:hypothetical protein